MEKKDLRIVFMGTPEFAVGTLRCLVEEGYNVVAVVTQPDKPVGRHARMTAPAVKCYAAEHGIPVLQPLRLRDEAFLSQLAGYKPDVQVVVAFRLLPESVWSLPRYGTFNVHTSLLPQYRGAAPINWVIINGEKETGCTSFFLDNNIDTGRIIRQERCPIPATADAAWLAQRLMVLAAHIATQTIDDILQYGKDVPAFPQAMAARLLPAPKIFHDTCRITWDAPAQSIYNFIRGLSPTPCAWTALSFTGDNQSLQAVKIYRSTPTAERSSLPAGTLVVERKRLLVATADYFLQLDDLQLAGKRRMLASDLINGLRP